MSRGEGEDLRENYLSMPMQLLTKENDVRNKEGGPTVVVGEEGKSPYIAETDRKSDTGENEFQSRTPMASLFCLL